jgi:CheY-like chemotaxis protein
MANWFRHLFSVGEWTASSPSDASPLLEPESARALVVDDSEVARRALEELLEASGFEVTTAASSRDAQAQVARRAPGGFDVILMDLHMPDGTGIEACARIKQRAGWQDVPVIVVTSSEDDEDLTLAFAAGATDYVIKPPREVEILARVRAALRLKHEMTRRRVREGQLERLNERLREQATELSAAKGALQDLNRDLERRVGEQVHEIVARASEIEQLNAQLRVQVQERSRELAEALRRLSGPGPRRREATPGEVLGGRVRLVRRLAEGGMGAIYVGTDLVTGTAVAVKLLDVRLGSGERELHRFINEAAAAAAIAHPAIVKTTHVDVTADGVLFLIMELVNGVGLDAVLARGPVPAGSCAGIGRVVADALAAAHRAGVVHRDVKPANLMICRTAPGVRVLDFGISKIRSLADRITLTETDGLLGTPSYMAPEQLENASSVTPATDVYGLGAVMFEMVTGARPFEDLRARLRNVDGEAPRLADRAAGVPAPLAAVIDQCLARRPADRPQARELTARLAALATELRGPAPGQLLEVLGHRPPSLPAGTRP